MKLASIGFAAIGAISLGYLLTRKDDAEPAAKPARSRKTAKQVAAPRMARRTATRRRKHPRRSTASTPAKSST